MSYDYEALFTRIVDVVSAAGRHSERMGHLIDECERQCPHPQWSALRTVDFNSDVARIDTWMSDVLSELPAGTSPAGLWFGLNNPVVGRRSTADIYVSATQSFAPPEIDWASDSAFYAESRYLGAQGLDSIYRLAYDDHDGLGNDAEYPLVLAYGSMLACDAVKALRLEGPLANLEGCAAGFDSGDLLFLGSFADGAFVENVVAG